MKAVIDRVVQYPNRFKLTDVSTGAVLGTFDLDAVTGAVSVVGTKINKELFDSIASDIEARVKTSGGDVSQTSETFTASSVRNNLTSGETISVSMGKIYKWLNDLKALAFKDSLGKADVGLGNIDNTTDKDKPISTATQTALDKKQDTLVSGTNIKTINSTSILGSGDITIASTSYTAGDNITITTDNKINANCVPLGTVYGTGAGNLAGGTGSVAGTSGQNYTNMTAYGASAKASGNYSTAIGSASTASGDFSTASGYGSTANGNYSTASGNFSTASGYGSTASGSNSTASGSYSTASGYNSNSQRIRLEQPADIIRIPADTARQPADTAQQPAETFQQPADIIRTASGNGSTAIGSLYLSPNAFGSYNNIENSVTFDGKYNSTYPTVHPNAIIHFGYLSNIVIRNSDQTSTAASVLHIIQLIRMRNRFSIISTRSRTRWCQAQTSRP
jgi:hypothetical protein